MRVRHLALLLAAQLGMPGCAGGQLVAGVAPTTFVRADTTALRRALDSLSNAHQGVVGYAVHDLDTGERLERRGDETFPTASLIRFPSS
jgi:beta-lactamase class A